MATPPKTDSAPPRHLPGEYLVRFRPAALRASISSSGTARSGLHKAKLAPDSSEGALVHQLSVSLGLHSVEAVYATDGPQTRVNDPKRMASTLARTVTAVTHERQAGYAVLRFDADRSSTRIERMLQGSEELELVEPVPARWLTAARQPSATDNRQWALRAIDFFGRPLPSARRVPVAVLDSGIDLRHPLLPPSQVPHYDHDGLSPDDLEGHGTHVAGTIAALTDDIVGCSGITDCPLLVWKVIGDRVHGDGRRYVAFPQYLRALEAVIDSGAQVLNLSLGGTASSATEALLFGQLEAADVFVVAAMGNEFDAGNPTVFPAAYPGVHAVAATNELDAQAPFSNTGRHAFISAPGVNVLSTLPVDAQDPPFGISSGTSMATPHVTAVAALVRARHPDWSVAQVAHHLARTARPAYGQRAGRRSHTFGHGIVQLADALR